MAVSLRTMTEILDDYIEAVNCAHSATLAAKNNVAPEYLARKASRKLQKVRTAVRGLCKAAEDGRHKAPSFLDMTGGMP